MKKILIVDDKWNIRNSLSIGLKRIGYNVDTVNSARTALLNLAQKSYDILLTDLQMPETDGYHLANIVQQLHPNTKIILMSAYDFFEYQNRYEDIKNFKQLAKPFELMQLVNLINVS